MRYLIAYNKITGDILSILRGGGTITENPEYTVIEVNSELGESIKQNPEGYRFNFATNTFGLIKV